jgi:hypothetical protein
MISPRIARRVAQLHKWLGLIVGAQLVIWTATGLFFAAFAIADVRGDGLISQPSAAAVDLSQVKLSTLEALQAVVEDRPSEVVLRPLAGRPVYEIRAAIGVFLVAADTGEVLSPISEDTARTIALTAWKGPGELQALELLADAPRESGVAGEVWAARFSGDGNPVLYVSATTGQAGPVRTDLWRTYDFLWSLHIMDYQERENFNHPLIIAAAVLALSVTLLGVVLLVQRFTRGRS